MNPLPRTKSEKIPMFILIWNNTRLTNIQDRYVKNDAKIILYTEDVDKLYTYFKNDQNISKLISFENEPIDASWGERYFHIRDPDGHLLSFAKTIKNRE